MIEEWRENQKPVGQLPISGILGNLRTYSITADKSSLKTLLVMIRKSKNLTSNIFI